MQTPRWPLTGRDALVEQIKQALVARRLAVVLLRGPGGIGKSRLADEAGAALAQRFTTVRIVATPSLSAVPLGALAAFLSSPTHRRGQSDVRDRSGIREPEVDYSSLDAVRLLSHIRQVTVSASQGRRLLLVVDDVPWLDPLSMSVLAALLQNGDVSMLATARDDEPVPDALLALWNGDRALRMDLPLLTASDCQELISASLSGPVSAQLADALFRGSAGNPLHLRELVAETNRQGRLNQVRGVWRLSGDIVGSPALTELVQRRLDALTPMHREIAERVALCQPATVDEIIATSGPDAYQLLTDLEEDGLLLAEEDQSGSLTARIAHPQYAAVIRSTISRLKATRILMSQVSLVEAGPARPGDELRTGLWRLEATGVADADLLLRAARLARVAHDFTAVRRLASAATRSADPAWAGLPEAQLLLGEAHRELGQPHEAAAVLAAATAQAAPDPMAARIAVMMAYVIADEGGEHLAQAHTLLDHTRIRLPGQAAGLLAAQAALLTGSNSVTEALRKLDQAQTEAAGTAHPDWAPVAAKLLSGAGQTTEALTYLEPARVSSTEAFPYRGPGTAGLPHPDTDPVHGSALAMGQARALLVAGQFDEGVAAARRGLQLAVADGMDRSITLAEWQLAAAFLHAGLPRTAARWCNDVVSGAHTHGPHSHIENGLAGLALARAWLNDLTGAREAFTSIDTSPGDDNPWRILAGAWIQALEGSTDQAVARLEAAAEHALAGGNAAVGTAFLQAVVRLGRPAVAADLLEEVARMVDAPVISMRARHARAAADQDVSALCQVAEDWATMGARLDAAEAAAQAVAAATAATAPVTASARLPRLITTLSIRAETLAGLCEGAVPIAAVSRAATALTSREREIAVLASRGLASQDIANRLHLSVRTVNNHLQASYQKLGIGSRRELSTTLTG